MNLEALDVSGLMSQHWFRSWIGFWVRALVWDWVRALVWSLVVGCILLGWCRRWGLLSRCGLALDWERIGIGIGNWWS